MNWRLLFRPSRGERLLVLALILISLLPAQVYYATLIGTVRDASGAVVPDAEVVVTEANTRVTATVRTDAMGDYRLTTLRPGPYVVRASAKGFSEKTIQGVELFVAKTSRVDVRLELGAVADTVSISGSAPLVQTETAERGGIMEGEEVKALPLSGRDFQSLTLLMPGVSTGSDYSGTNISANGMGVNSNMFYVDGGGLANLKMSAPVEKVNIDSIAEFKMETANYAADRGIKAGSAISVATKNGTNDLHATLFEFFRNDKLNTRTYFAATRPTLRYNDFGGTVGGPVKKNKIFFFISAEATRQPRSSTAVASVPTAAERDGNFASGTGVKNAIVYDPLSINAAGLRNPFADNRVPRTRWSPVAIKYLDFWPQPQTSALTNNFRRNVVARTTMGTYAGRLDYTISAKDTVYFRYANQSNPYFNEPTLPAGSTSYTGDSASGSDMVVAWTHMLNANTLNEARFSFANVITGRYPASYAGQNLSKQLGYENGDRLPQSMWGCPGLAFSSVSTSTPCGLVYSENQSSKTFFFTDDFSFRRGSHNFKTGFLAMRYYDDEVFGVAGGAYATFTGRFTSQMNDLAGGQPFGDFLLGSLAAVRVNESVQVSPDQESIYHFYFMDDWKVNSKLTVQLGFRYEMNLPATIANGQAAAWIDGLDKRTGQTAVFPANAKDALNQVLKGTELGYPYRFTDNNWLNLPNWRNLSPRIGIAWRPFGDTKTVVRGGFGVYYDLKPLTMYANKNYGRPFYLAANTPARSTEFEAPPYSLGQVPFVRPGYQPGEQFNSGYTSIAHWPDTRSDHWNITIQRELGLGMALEAGYVGNRDMNGTWYHAWNRIYPAGYTFRYDDGSSFTVKPDTPLLQSSKYPELLNNYGGLFTGFHGMYNGLQLYLAKRMTHGLSFRAGYTRSHSYGVDGADRTQDEFTMKDQNFTRLNDRPNVFFGTYVWQLPGQSWRGVRGAVLGGWTYAGVLRLESGQPLDVAETQPSYQGAANLKATLLSGRDPMLSAGERSVARWFDTSAFVRPDTNQFGNAIGVLRAAPIRSLDMALSKSFRIREGHRLEFRGEAFNVPNHAWFSAPNTSRGDANFGRITGTRGTGREFQLGLKYLF